MTKLNSASLEAYLLAHNIPGEVLRLEVPTPTVETAAAAVGCLPEQIVKSILFLVKGEPVLAVTCGQRYVEQRAIAARFGVGRKKVKLARPKIVLDISGYEVGAMPPFGHLQPLQTLLDPSVLAHEQVYAGGGAGNTLLRISPQAIQDAAAAEVLDLHTRPNMNN